MLPTAWFRNTWSWDAARPGPPMAAADAAAVAVGHPFFGPLELIAGPAPDGALPALLFCENETNVRRLFGAAAGHAVPEGRHQRPRGQRRADRESRAHRHQVRVLVPG